MKESRWFNCILIVLCVLFGSHAYGENRVEYNPLAATVPNRVTNYVSSGDQSAYLTDPNNLSSVNCDCLVGVDVSALAAVPQKHWKVSGSSVVEMTSGEKTLIQAEIDANAAAAEAARIVLFDTTISTVQTGTYSLPKIDAKIDNISNLDDAKAFLKKLARYLIDD